MWPRSLSGMPLRRGCGGIAAGKTCPARSAAGSQFWLTMPSRTKFQRCSDMPRSTAGSHRDGDWMSPASIAPSDTESCETSFPKYACDAAWMP